MERSWLALQRSGSAGITGLGPATPPLVCREGKWCRSGKNGATPPYENNKGRKKYPKNLLVKNSKNLCNAHLGDRNSDTQLGGAICFPF